jgi:hypothetical protein
MTDLGDSIFRTGRFGHKAQVLPARRSNKEGSFAEARISIDWRARVEREVAHAK